MYLLLLIFICPLIHLDGLLESEKAMTFFNDLLTLLTADLMAYEKVRRSLTNSHEFLAFGLRCFAAL